jgi:asparagine synthase (glutamine-hydrolysing)
VNYFVCLLDLLDRGISPELRRRHEALPRIRGLHSQWKHAPGAAVLAVWDDQAPTLMTAHDSSYVAVGYVRLDNRAHLERLTECDAARMTDLELVLRIVAIHGTQYIKNFLGDFAFVVWNGCTRTAVAACDAFAVKKLYYSDRDTYLLFASRAEALAEGDRYEVQYFAELLALHAPRSDVSPYFGVRPIPAGSWGVFTRTQRHLSRYWSAERLSGHATWRGSEQEAIDTCRQLLVEAVRLRLAADGKTWADLSGGLDSSSIVSISQWLAANGEAQYGLAGTVSFVGVEGTGTDERAYSDAVVRQWKVRNEKIVNPPTWYEEGYSPPYTDLPSFDLVCFPRDRRICALLREAGAKVLLTGWGGDELFTSSMLFFADWVVEGRVWPAIREMSRRAAMGRVSFWELAYKNSVLPFLPAWLQRMHGRDGVPVQTWLSYNTLRHYGLDPDGTSFAEDFQGPIGGKYRHVVLSRIGALSRLPVQEMVGDTLDVRHPMLHRPLVEYAAALPPELRGKPYAHRWVLREAMRGMVPDLVRTRVGKGGTGEILARSLSSHRHRLAGLLRDPILAQLGVLDADRLRAAFDATLHLSNPRQYTHGPVLSTLAVEAWLQMRSGRWP